MELKKLKISQIFVYLNALPQGKIIMKKMQNATYAITLANHAKVAKNIIALNVLTDFNKTKILN